MTLKIDYLQPVQRFLAMYYISYFHLALFPHDPYGRHECLIVYIHMSYSQERKRKHYHFLSCWSHLRCQLF